MAANYNSIPEPLRWPAKWLQYYLSPDPKHPQKKPKKRPCLKWASPEDRAANLRNLDYLIANRQLAKGGGYQRYVDKAENFTYVDLDKCRNPETGDVEPWALDLIEWLDTYTEISASGAGFHLVAQGTVPVDFHADPNPVEIYAGNTNKLIAMTGDVFNLHVAIEDRQSQLTELLARLKKEAPGKLDSPVPVVEHNEKPIEEEPLPEFPQFTGSLAELATALCPDLPYCHKFMAALTLVGGILSGKVHLDDARYIDPRFYMVLIDVGGAGKGGAWTQIRDALASVRGDLCIKNSVESGPSLVQHLAFEPRTLLFSDELSALFEKAKVTGSSKNTLFSELLTLHDGHETENDAKSNLELATKIRNEICDGSSIKVTNAHLSMLGLVQPAIFQTMWGGTKGGSSGLQSRMALASSGQLTVPEPQAPSDFEKVEAAVARIKRQIEKYTAAGNDVDDPSQFIGNSKTILRPAEIGKRQRDWWKERMALLGASSRLPALLSRFAMMLAITNDSEEITPELFEQVLAFGEYQIAMCARFMPDDSTGYVHSFEENIVRMFEKHGADGLTFRQVRLFVNPEKKKLLGGYGPFWTAWNNLLRCERIVVIAKTPRSVVYGLQN